ncbi:MAG: PD40 domain-containing protein, partial [Bryobacterales bacterium]|nr:PD40 domain-containing protein [Bryobacterales bacterium]
MSSVIPPESGPLAALERILTAPEFAQADRLQQLLRFLAEKAIAGDTGAVKETVIGVEVFGREPGYDPKIDSVVRTEVRRLRLKLQDYYAGSGAADPIRIEIPKGAYQVTFRDYVPSAVTAALIPDVVPPATPPQGGLPPASSKTLAPAYLWAAAGVVGIVAVAAGLWLFPDPKPVRARIPVEPVLLTQSIGQATHPSLTADGSTVVYAFSEGANSGIYLLRTDGQSAPRRLAGTRARDFNPVIHPDGTKVAYLREEGAAQFALLVQGVDDPEPKRWAAIDRRDRIAWVPDGKRMIVSMRLTPAAPASLVLISDSGLRTVVTSPPPGTLLDGAPVFSPDYRTLAFLRATESSVDEIYIVPVGPDFLPRAEPRKLTNEKRRFAGFCFSPDGTSLLASLQRGRSVRALWRIPIEAPERMERLPEAGIQAAYPTLAARASRVVYSIGIDDLNLYRRNGNDPPKALSPSNTLDSSPAISPDGTQIAFRSARSGTSEIWVMRSDG